MVRKESEYDISGHVVIPFNKKTQEIFFRTQRNVDYALWRNGVKLENITRIPKSFVNKYLTSRGFEIKGCERIVMIPKSHVNGISIGVTKIQNDSETVDLLISVHSKDMRSLIKSCDSMIEYVESHAGIKINSGAKLWTRQELC